MKDIAQLRPALLFLFLFTLKGLCGVRVHCQWGPYGDWSVCDSCTSLQTRSRVMAVYAQFGGSPCGGAQTQTRPCDSTQTCPLETGCADRFRCRSGKCVSQSLVCNGDQDCEEDGDDEQTCDPTLTHLACEHSTPPPDIEKLGLGIDAVTGKERAIVINTKSFGGQCRLSPSGVHRRTYRLPLSTDKYTFRVTVKNDFSDEMFKSTWHYAKDIVNRETVRGTTTGYRNYDFHEKVDKTKGQRILVLKNDIEYAQFQSTSAKYLPIAEGFWKALSKLPVVYDFAAYRQVLERFGTHYRSEGSLGGSFKVVARIDEDTERRLVTESSSYNECERTKRWILFFPLTIVKCKDGSRRTSRLTGHNFNNEVLKVAVEGGDVQHRAALHGIRPQNNNNWDLYTNWAESIRYYPKVTKQELRPVSELVKEVQCAGVKKLYLRRAIEQYLDESDACHCRPCSNNGLAVMDGNVCKCICKPGTEGLACEQGTEVEGQRGVIHGIWSCWSAWSTCSNDRRSRSRSCSNPAPRNGGQSCIGEPTVTSECGDKHLAYLKTMEPQCFDLTLAASKKCGTPPALINGYILNPKDVYLVGSRVEYACIGNSHLTGQSIIECTADETWSANPGRCTMTMCRLSLADDVIADPDAPMYRIGEAVTLSCPKGRQLLGEAVAICDPSLNFSPDPLNSKCSPVVVAPEATAPPKQCEQWEKNLRGKCVCRMPFECGSSLELCTTSPASGVSILITVCKLQALQCLKKDHVIAEDSSCTWPEGDATRVCTKCHMWETCDDQTNVCRCRDSADCSTPGTNVCVRIGDDATAATQTMSECEAGLRRCKGEKVSVTSLVPCSS